MKRHCSTAAEAEIDAVIAMASEKQAMSFM
jgi:hypothetical protein